MQLVNYTQQLQRLIEKAQAIALAHQHPHCDEHHLLASLLQDPITQTILTQAGGKLPKIEATNQAVLDQYPATAMTEKKITRQVVAVLLACERVSQAYTDRFVSVDSLLIAMAEHTESQSLQHVFKQSGLSAKAIRIARDNYRNGRVITHATDDTEHPLRDYSRNLTDLGTVAKRVI